MVWGQAFSYYAVSLDGINFTDIATSRTPTGEDRNILFNGDEFYSYGRLAASPTFNNIFKEFRL